MRPLDFTETDIDDMARLYRNGHSTLNIARRYGCLSGSVWARLKKRGVAMRGVGAPRQTWLITSHGYVRYRTKYLHRIVAEAWRGMPLQPGEVVHHINGVKTDNHPDNLEIIANNGVHVGERHIGQWTPEDDWLVVRSRDTGATAAQIASVLNIGVHAATNRAQRLRRKGVTGNVAPGPKGGVVPSDVLWAIREMDEVGISTRDTLLDAQRNPGADIRRHWS